MMIHLSQVGQVPLSGDRIALELFVAIMSPVLSYQIYFHHSSI